VSQPCPVCASTEFESLLELTEMPAQDGVVYETRKAALEAPRGDIRLAVCRRCHYIGNSAFDAHKVRFVEYSYAQHHSEQYRKHVDALVTSLIDRYSLRNKTVIDIGCGEGFFLDRMCRAGGNRGVGIDPSLPTTDEIDGGRLTLIRDHYSEKYAHHRGALVSCRHVIDELPAPREFLESIVGALAPDAEAILYLELPNAMRTFEGKLIWNVGYAKRSWFTPSSLGALLRLCDLEVVRTEALFDGEYMGIVGRRATDSVRRTPFPEEPSQELIGLIDGFRRHFESEIDRWSRRVDQMRAHQETMIVWGAGMRGINFLSRFGDETVFPRIVDINPHRQGSYLPGSGYFVDAPEVLGEYPPDRVLLSNPTYEKEIRRHLAEMGVVGEVELL
jgi:SAM-dependent methyltransferase